jgi:hypothetical protein
MPPIDQAGRIYQELANYYELHNDAPMRDRFLVLTADALFSAGRKDDAEKVRGRLLHANANHLLKPYRSMAEAIQSRDVRDYIDGLRRTYPPQAAEQLLDSLRGKPDAARAASRAGAEPTPPPLESPVSQRSQGAAAPRSERPDTSQSRSPALATGSVAAESSASRGGPQWSEPRPVSWRRDGWLDGDKSERPAGAWVPGVLFWLALAGGVALACYGLAWPLPRP